MEKHKNGKRFIAVVLALVMMLSMNIVVFAGSAAPGYPVDFYYGDVKISSATLTYNEIGDGLPDCGADGWRFETYLVSEEDGTETRLEAWSYTSSADNNVVTEELMDMLSGSTDAGSAGYTLQYKAFTNRDESGSGGTYTDGNGIVYTLENGVLTITGDGPCGSYWQDEFDIASVVEAVIESGITSIDTFAFSYCSSLESVTIPDSVTSINHAAFRGCSSLESVTIPDSVTSIGSSAFLYCSSLTSVTIPSSVTSIGYSAFSGCTALTNITIPNGVTKIGSSAFTDTAYYNNEENWKNDVLYIDNCLIEARLVLSGDYSIKDGTKLIADDAFAGCTSLTSVSIPNSVTSIGSYAFADCSSLRSVTIPDSITSIGGGAFYDCSSLTSVSIPDSVTSIGDYAFSHCSSLTDVYYTGTEKQWNAISIGYDNDCLKNATIHYTGKTHTHDYTDTVTAPTCTERGYTTHTCACGDSYVDSYVDALGHSYKDGACTVCGEKDAGYVPPHEHSYTDVVTAPTCTDKGYTTHTCDCGDSFADTYVDALGHSYKDGACTVCGAADPDYKEPTPSVTFTDVADSAYYAKPVAWAVANNITGGYSDNTFRPMNVCTRAQIVTFIWRANGSPEPVGTAKGFTDVAEGTYYYKAVLWAAEQGITGGFDDGGFHPDELVTRAQAMTFLWRAEGKPAVPAGTVNTFKDVPETAYYHDAVLWAVANGVTGGYDATTFGSMDGCTRAQIVTFLYRDMAQ